MTTAGRPDGHAWLPASPCTVRACLPADAPAVGPARKAARWTALAAVVATALLAAPFVRGTRAAPAAARTLTRGLLRAVGVRLRVGGTRGRALRRAALVVGNHTSWLDVAVVAAVRPGRMLAKSEIAAYPVLGRLATYGGTLFVEREKLRALPGTVATIADLLRSGSTVVAFPEGSTWCGRSDGPFRNAVFQAALDAAVPVQPVSVRYRQRGAGAEAPTTVAAFVGEDTLHASLRRVIASRGLAAEVTLLPAVPAGTHRSRSALAGAVARAVSATGNLPTPDGPRRWPGEGEGEDLPWRRTGTTGSTTPRGKEPRRSRPRTPA
ncbi:lysophospholipid acyltransferase family protein [Streptomyces sp. TR02-1]|uniref:lysophospholipid acyltransferase family protein n=1 Tax=Streptomyces sp. TR02-1 TaxID=3385977 RepID=UPI0039A20F1C